MKILTVINNDYAVTDETTYRQLKDLLPDTTGVKTPTKDWIKGNEPICSVKFDGGETQVYANGFYTYSVGNNSTILRVDGFSHVRYRFDDWSTALVGEDEYADKPFAIALALNGEAQLEKNLNKKEQYHHQMYVDNENDGFLVEIATPDFVAVNEAIEEKKETNARLNTALNKLTDKQRQIFLMYYDKGITQEQIAQELGVSQPYIVKALNRAVEILKKNF